MLWDNMFNTILPAEETRKIKEAETDSEHDDFEADMADAL